MNSLFFCALVLSDASALRPVLDSHVRCLLGASDGKKWVDDDTAAKLVKGGEHYRLVYANGQIGDAVGGKASSAGEPCAGTLSVPLKPEPDRTKEYIAISGDWDPRPRTPVDLAAAKGKYEALFAPALLKKGVKAAPQIRQLMRVDLDADGKDEVIALLSNISDDGANGSRVDAYSAVLVRGIVSGRVETSVVDLEQGEREGGASQLTIPLVADLDGDGHLEIVVFGHYAQGDFTTVYSFRNGHARRVSSCACGE
jgi:hypothetical protein